MEFLIIAILVSLFTYFPAPANGLMQTLEKYINMFSDAKSVNIKQIVLFLNSDSESKKYRNKLNIVYF